MKSLGADAGSLLAPQFLYALSETTSPAASYSITSHTSIVVFSSTTTCHAKEMSRERERKQERKKERERVGEGKASGVLYLDVRHTRAGG
jgi:hypothetical protein